MSTAALYVALFLFLVALAVLALLAADPDRYIDEGEPEVVDLRDIPSLWTRLPHDDRCPECLRIADGWPRAYSDRTHVAIHAYLPDVSKLRVVDVEERLRPYGRDGGAS